MSAEFFGNQRSTIRPLARATIAAAVCLWALLLYQPWQTGPLSTTDFSDFLPLLRSHSGAVAQWQAMSRFYAAEGRFYPLTVGWIVARWSWFGLSGGAWYAAAVLLQLCIVTIAYGVLRRLGAARFGALLGAALFVVGVGARDLWLIPQLGDSLGLTLLLLAVWMAAGYQRNTHPLRSATITTLLVLAMECTKETFVAAVPFVLGVALCYQGEDRWDVPRVTRRNASIVASIGLTTTLLLVPILLVRRGGNHDAYAAQYGLRGVSIDHVATTLGAMLIPSAGHIASATGAVFSVLVLAGWFRRVARVPRRSPSIALGVALLLPLLGAAVYLPWPIFRPYYAAPFVLGAAYLTAMAATDLARATPRLWRWVPAVAATCLVVEGSRAAFGAAQEGLATRRVLGESVTHLPRAGQASAVVLPGSVPLYPLGWFEMRFAQYAAAALTIRCHPCVAPTVPALLRTGAHDPMSRSSCSPGGAPPTRTCRLPARGSRSLIDTSRSPICVSSRTR